MLWFLFFFLHHPPWANQLVFFLLSALKDRERVRGGGGRPYVKHRREDRIGYRGRGKLEKGSLGQGESVVYGVFFFFFLSLFFLAVAADG